MVGVFRNTLGNDAVKDEPQDKAGYEFLSTHLDMSSSFFHSWSRSYQKD